MSHRLPQAKPRVSLTALAAAALAAPVLLPPATGQAAQSVAGVAAASSPTAKDAGIQLAAETKVTGPETRSSAERLKKKLKKRRKTTPRHQIDLKK